MEQLRGKNERELQIESYFREVSGRDLNEVLSDWATLIDDLNDQERSQSEINEHVKKLTTKTFVYGSPRTTKILGMMQQHSYSQNKRGKNAEKDPNNTKLIVYTSFMIASLKEDFTGYRIDPTAFLKIRLTDFSTPVINEKITNFEKEILEELEEEGIKWEG